MADTWPPPESVDDVWLPARAPFETEVREAKLWGRFVWINRRGSVLCPGCGRMVNVAELGRVDNRHQVGLPNRAARRLGLTLRDATRDEVSLSALDWSEPPSASPFGAREPITWAG